MISNLRDSRYNFLVYLASQKACNILYKKNTLICRLFSEQYSRQVSGVSCRRRATFEVGLADAGDYGSRDLHQAQFFFFSRNSQVWNRNKD